MNPKKVIIFCGLLFFIFAAAIPFAIFVVHSTDIDPNWKKVLVREQFNSKAIDHQDWPHWFYKKDEFCPICGAKSDDLCILVIKTLEEGDDGEYYMGAPGLLRLYSCHSCNNLFTVPEKSEDDLQADLR